MGATTPNGNLASVTREDVDRWLREAWPNRTTYPGACACEGLATAINTIVHRTNTISVRGQSIEATKKHRANLVEARRHAGSLLKNLAPVRDHHQSALDQLESASAPSVFGPEPNELTVINDLHCAVEAFLALGRPLLVRDHQDPILWIERETKRAWDSVSKTDAGKLQADVRFGKKPDSELVWFIFLVLKAIGIKPVVRLNTIIDHLRERQNRPRDRRKASREGAK